MKRLHSEEALQAGVDRLHAMQDAPSAEAIVTAVCDAVDAMEDEIAIGFLYKAIDRVPLVGTGETHDQAQGRLDSISTFHIDAVGRMRRMPVSVLTGPSGPERRRILLIVADMHRETMRSVGIDTTVMVLASTRRDAMLMGPGATTVHDALGWDPVTRTFERGAFNPIEADLIVVDQADLLDTATLTLLLAARNGATVILTRDPTMLGSTIPAGALDVEMEPDAPAA